MNKIKDRSLYLVISEEYGMGRTAVQIAGAAISGGVDILQMREKDKSRQELSDLGLKLSALCRKNGTIFIVNDDPALAREVRADGVHLGQEDIKKFPLKELRKTIGNDKIIGISTHSFEQFEEANSADVDYIAFGPIFRTKTKDYFVGTGDIKTIIEAAKKPVFFIGGIDLSNIDDVLKEGARNIALIRGILEADDITAKTRQFKERLERLKGDLNR